MAFLICKTCTLFQRQEDILYEINFNFGGGQFTLDYYPYFLIKKEYDCVDENSCMFFSLKAISYLLQGAGYKVTDAHLEGNKLNVAFQKLNTLEKIEQYEMRRKLDSQFTYFLLSLKKK